jgi:hypothetical protein
MLNGSPIKVAQTRLLGKSLKDIVWQMVAAVFVGA